MRASSAPASFSAAVAHHADLAIQLHQARFDLRQPSPRFLAGLLRFLHRFLDRRRAGAEHPGQVLAAGPDNHSRNDGKIQQHAQQGKRSRCSVPCACAMNCTDGDCLNSAVSSFSSPAASRVCVHQLLAEDLAACSRRWTAVASGASPAVPARAAILWPRQNSPRAAPAASSDNVSEGSHLLRRLLRNFGFRHRAPQQRAP